MRGQGYDGASNMNRKYRGIQARVKELYPLAMYTHCCKHVLNLVISTSSQLPVIRNAMATIRNTRFSIAFCTARIDISKQCWKRSFSLGFFATEGETNLRHTLGRKTWLAHHLWHYCQQLFLHLANYSRKTCNWMLRPKQQLCSILYRNARFFYLAQLSVKLVTCRLSFVCYHCLEHVRQWFLTFSASRPPYSNFPLAHAPLTLNKLKKQMYLLVNLFYLKIL